MLHSRSCGKNWLFDDLLWGWGDEGDKADEADEADKGDEADEGEIFCAPASPTATPVRSSWETLSSVACGGKPFG